MSDQQFRISTTLNKSQDDPSVLDFIVECRPIGDDGEVTSEVVGKLKGFLIEPGYLPEEYEDWYCDVFDQRSGHAADAYEILLEERALIGKALPKSDLLEIGNGVALLEHASVQPSHRGKGLALRLMREAKHVLGRYGLLAMLKAHPDGDEISDDQKLRLAAYYTTDKHLALKPLSKERLPGWLVAHWGEPELAKGDQYYWPAQ